VPPWLTDLFARYGYAAVFFGVFLENTGLPVPGETMVLAGGALAHYGHLSLVRVILVTMVAAVLGDNLGFLIGRRGGRRLIVRFSGRFGITRRRLDDFDRFFERHGPKTVFVARFITGLRVFCAVLAGGSGMRWRTFLFFNATGAVVWSITIAVVGYVLGHSWDTLERLIGGTGIVGSIVVVVLVVLWIARTRRQSS
jgi:membrane protein DedA with SNARE-associated domain